MAHSIALVARAGVTVLLGAVTATALLMLPVPLSVAVALAENPSAGPSAPARDELPPGWLLMERFGQAPDGSTSELDFGRRQLWLVRPDGTELHELSPGAPESGKASPDVSADGRRIAFASWHPTYLVYQVGLEDSEPRLVSTDCSGDAADCAEFDPAWSPDGSRLVVVRLEVIDGVEWSWLAIRDLASGERIDLPATKVAWDDGSDREGYVAQPSWSPDGSHIAYHRTPRAEDGRYPSGIEGWVVDAGGGDPVRLSTPDGEDAADLDWSPDGSRIAYSTVGAREFEGVEAPPARIISIRPDGSDPVLLCDDSRPGDDGCWAPSWMPGGDLLIFYGYRTWNLVGADGTGNAPIDEANLTWFGDEPGQGYGYVAVWAPES